MTQTPSNAALLDAALTAIREVMDRLDRRPPAAPSTASAVATGSTGRVEDPAPIMQGASPAQQLALHHYLASASLLLDASLMLMRQPTQRSTMLERSRQWSALIQQTKVAGRMVYGAALALADPGSTSSPSSSPATSSRT